MTTLEEDILGLMGGDGDGSSKANKNEADNLSSSSEDEDVEVLGSKAKKKSSTGNRKRKASAKGKTSAKKGKKRRAAAVDSSSDDENESDVNEDSEDEDDEDVSFSSDEGESEEEDEDESEEEELDDDDEDLPAMPLKKRGKAEKGKKKKGKVDKDKAGESDGDSDGSLDFNLEDYDDGYGSDLMGDSEDRERLLAMNELDREMELYDRQEKRDELRRQKEIMLEMKAERDKKKAKAAKKTTRSQSKASNKKKTPADKRKNALSQLLARRDKKVSSRDALRNMADERELEYQDYDDGYEYGDDDYYSDEEEDEYGTIRRKSKSGRGSSGKKKRFGGDNLEEGELGEEYDVEASFEELQGVLITRNKILEWIREPFLEDVMVDQFIRLAIGSTTDQQSGEKKSVYRLVQVVEVYERKPGKYQAFKNDPFIRSPYQLAPGISTNKWLKVKIGKSTATFPMTIVSNSKLEEAEFEKYCEDCSKAGVKQPLRSDCRFAKNAQKEAKEFRYSSADVQKLIEKRGRKASNYAAERQHLISERDWAREQGDEEKTKEFEEALAELERKEAARRRAKGASALSNINQRNVAKNFEKMYHLTASSDKGSKMEKSDPFSRRPTAPLNYWSTKKRGQTESPEKGPTSGKDPIEKTLNFEDQDTKKALAEEEEEHGKFPGIDIDFKVDLSLLDQPAQRTKLILSSLKDGIPKITKALSISEYFEQVKMVQEQVNN